MTNTVYRTSRYVYLIDDQLPYPPLVLRGAHAQDFRQKHNCIFCIHTCASIRSTIRRLSDLSGGPGVHFASSSDVDGLDKTLSSQHTQSLTGQTSSDLQTVRDDSGGNHLVLGHFGVQLLLCENAYGYGGQNTDRTDVSRSPALETLMRSNHVNCEVKDGVTYWCSSPTSRRCAISHGPFPWTIFSSLPCHPSSRSYRPCPQRPSWGPVTIENVSMVCQP